MEVVGTVSGDGATIQVSAEYTGSGTTFQIEVVDGVADLRGFFFDYLELDGNTLSVGQVQPGIESQARDNNGSWLDHAVTDWYLGSAGDGDDVTMFGSNENNVKGTGESFDAGLLFGLSGGMTESGANDDVQYITFTVDGLTLDEIDGMEFGIRALSVGGSEDSREGSVKLLGTFDVTDIPPEDVPL